MYREIKRLNLQQGDGDVLNTMTGRTARAGLPTAHAKLVWGQTMECDRKSPPQPQPQSSATVTRASPSP